MENLTDKGQKLFEVQQTLKSLKETYDNAKAPYEAEREELQAQILESMRQVGVKTLKTDKGFSVVRASRRGFEIISEPHALKWAIENMAVSINRTLMGQKLKEAETLPECFKAVENEYVSIKTNETADEN